MRNKKVVVDFADINSQTVQEIDIPYTFSGTTLTGNTYSNKTYPNEIQIINNTNADLEWIVIRDDDEYEEYIANSGTMFDFIPFPKDSTLEDNKKFYKADKFLIRGTESTADEDLNILFINYSNLL